MIGPYPWQREETTPRDELQISDVISLGAEVLFLIRLPPQQSFGFPNKESLECQYGSSTSPQKVLTVHLLKQSFLAAVVCAAPPPEAHLPWDPTILKLDKDHEIRPAKGLMTTLLWNSTKVIYEVFPTEQDVAMFVHGFDQTLGVELSRFQCVYGGGEVATAVTAQASEVFRCGHPPKAVIQDFVGKKMSLRFDGKVLPSVAYYNPPPMQLNPSRDSSRDPSSRDPSLKGSSSRDPSSMDLSSRGPSSRYPSPQDPLSRDSSYRDLSSRDPSWRDLSSRDTSYRDPSSSSKQVHHICSCTMIYNGAKFLREWVYYHSHLGVEKFILYDNNSDDNLDEVIANLANFNVTKHSWPWVKTQQAAFSHCSLLAKQECTWMLFTDIDEYFFPGERFLLQNATTSILATLIQEAVASHVNVGQLATYCRNFGPSGLEVSPPEGVTQGYTCRLRKQRRHKSIVMLSAIGDSLGNQVHHFSLKPPHVKVIIRPWMAIINHYKFQVWDEFKTKFHRRAATYVADWTEDRNHASNDRVPGLGIKPVKPKDWESRYCEVHDYGLRDYTRRIFGDSHGEGKLHLAWE